MPADLRIASILFNWNKSKFIADVYGGPALDGDHGFCVNAKPDYSLFTVDYSLGYTFRYCPRSCEFCKVSKLETEKTHFSIWEFCDPRFKKICLLNNNTFADNRWHETFEEIWDAKLRVKDENGYDLRLINEDKANCLKRTKWDHGPKFAWDRMQDEKEIVRGFDEINRVGFKYCTIYVLTGYNTTIEEDIYRCQKIHNLGHNPFPMIYEETPMRKKFRRMIYARYYRKSNNIEKAWKEYSHVN